MAEQAELVPRGHRRPDDPPGDPALDVRAGGFYRRGGGREPRDLRLAAGCRRRAHRKGRFRSGLSFALHPALSVARAIHRSAWKKNSPKFKVASYSSSRLQPLDNRPWCSTPAPKRSDLVAVVAPMCIKGLRLVTMQLPEKFSSIGLGTNRSSHIRVSP